MTRTAETYKISGDSRSTGGEVCLTLRTSKFGPVTRFYSNDGESWSSYDVKSGTTTPVASGLHEMALSMICADLCAGGSGKVNA